MPNTDDTLWVNEHHIYDPILHHTHEGGPRHLWMLQKYWSQQYSTIISVVGGKYTVSAVYMILHSLAKGSIYIWTFYYIHAYLSFCMGNPNWGLLYHEDIPTQRKHKKSVCEWTSLWNDAQHWRYIMNGWTSHTWPYTSAHAWGWPQTPLDATKVLVTTILNYHFCSGPNIYCAVWMILHRVVMGSIYI